MARTRVVKAVLSSEGDANPNRAIVNLLLYKADGTPIAPSELLIPGISDIPGLQSALNALQASATAATDSELAAAVATISSALAAKEDASISATDAELAGAVATINTSLAAKQDASLAATDAELASAVSTINSAVSAKVSVSLLGVANGVATLGANAKLPTTQLPDSSRIGMGGVVVGHIGDSISGNGNDLTRWNTGLIGFITGQSALMWASLISAGRIQYGGSYGVAGYKVSQVSPQVALAKARGCDAVLINAGTNDVGAVTLAQTIIDYTALISTVVSADMLPILSTLPPRSDKSGNTTGNDAINLWLWQQAVANGYPLIDTYGALAADTAGTYASGMGADSLHPSQLGAKQIGLLVVDALITRGLIPPVAPAFLASAPTTNAWQILSNPGFINGTAGVTPSNWGADAGLTSSRGADATVGKGQVWTLVRNTADGNGYANFAIPQVAGHKYLFGFKIATSGIESGGGNWSFQFSAGSATILQLAAMAGDLPVGSGWLGTYVATNSTAAAWQWSLATAGTLKVAQPTLLDLTAAGLA